MNSQNSDNNQNVTIRLSPKEAMDKLMDLIENYVYSHYRTFKSSSPYREVQVDTSSLDKQILEIMTHIKDYINCFKGVNRVNYKVYEKFIGIDNVSMVYGIDEKYEYYSKGLYEQLSDLLNYGEIRAFNSTENIMANVKGYFDLLMKNR